MIIECPACHTQAKLPDSKEGAKVRCAECQRVYVARQRGAAANSKSDPTKIALIIGGVILLGVVMLMVRGGKKERVIDVVEPEPEKAPVVDQNGWDGVLVKFVREVHELVANGSEGAMLGKLDMERIYERQHADPVADDAPGPAEDVAGEGTNEHKAWVLMTGDERSLFQAETLADLLRGEGKELVGDWEPYDGWVVDMSDAAAVVRVRVSNREDPGLDYRHVEWHVVKVKGNWRAWNWLRWFSPEELEKERKARKKSTTKRTLSDGSLVIEGVIRPIDYMEDTPPQLRERIDSLVALLVDPEVRPKDMTRAREELKEIGKPAIPALLTQLATIPYEGDENAMLLNLVHLQLQEMTGYLTTFKVSEVLGGTKERSESGLKQWFGWYDRKFKKFQGLEKPEDPFFGMEPLSEKERREIERDMENERRNKEGQRRGDG